MRAWLITPPHPDLSKRRTITRRIGGRIATVFRVPVRCVDVLSFDDATARVRFDSKALGVRVVVEAIAPFEQLASTREKFVARFLQIAGALPEPAASPSGNTLPATTAAHGSGSIS